MKNVRNWGLSREVFEYFSCRYFSTYFVALLSEGSGYGLEYMFVGVGRLYSNEGDYARVIYVISF